MLHNGQLVKVYHKSLLPNYAVFDEVPTAWMLVGAAIVVFAGILIIWRERQLGLRRGTARRSGATSQA